jgi:hypothetical protein
MKELYNIVPCLNYGFVRSFTSTNQTVLHPVEINWQHVEQLYSK